MSLFDQIGVEGVRLLSCWVHIDAKRKSLCNFIAQARERFQQNAAVVQYWLSMNCSSSSLLLLNEKTPYTSQ